MKKILITGASGFIGKNIIPYLKNYYEVCAPNRVELDASNKNSVDNFLRGKRFDALLSLAVPRRGMDEAARAKIMFESFMNFVLCKNKFDKIIYMGSGAEFDQSENIQNVSEEQIGACAPLDFYARAKFDMNTIARESKNIYNLRLFGCYGKYEDSSRFIYHAIDCCKNKKELTIRQDRIFDYLYAEDAAPVVRWCIENNPRYHDYNVTSGDKRSLSEIAKIIIEKMNCNVKIKIEKEGWNNEYTADNTRLCSEFRDWTISPIYAGIEKQIDWQIN